MDDTQVKMQRINISLNAISLDAEVEDIAYVIEKVLVEKLLTTRRFNKGLMTDIVVGAWLTKTKGESPTN